MNIAIIGAATEGLSSCHFFMNQGDSVTVCDKDATTAVPYGASSQLGDNYLENLDRFDLVVRSPGIHPSIILEKNPTIGDKITSQVNEFLAHCPTKNVIGVTGTKGKGTTSTLITKILQTDGKTVFLGGNIGVPPFDFIADIKPDDWVVLELSSFQLIDLRHSPRIGVCLMVVPEHLNWHEDFEGYVSAKQQLFINQTEGDIAIYYGQNEDSESIAHASEGTIIPFMKEPGAIIKDDFVCIDGQQVCRTDEIKLLGKHNWQNACAAVTAVWQVTQNIPAIQSVLSSFAGMEHRLEFVRDFNQVKYYDDSFGTTPETAIVAIEAFQQPKILILGGSDKDSDYGDLAKTVKSNNVRKVLLIGDMSEKIGAELDSVSFTSYMPGGNTMSEIVNNARDSAQPGDIVLLSTACASFDMFKDYKDRGEQFKNFVRALA